MPDSWGDVRMFSGTGSEALTGDGGSSFSRKFAVKPFPYFAVKRSSN
jgi:hypothetical protein